MSDPTKDIAGLVECIVKPLVEYPDEVVVTSQEEDSGTAYVEIHVNDEDTGKVIGRQGRVIKSIRTWRAPLRRVTTSMRKWRSPTRCARGQM